MAKRNLSLGARLFLMSALLIALAVGVALGITNWRGQSIADEDIERSLSASQSVQRSFQEQRLRQLELGSQLLASDPAFVGYIAQATSDAMLNENVDTRSIVDLLRSRQQQLGIDLALVLDPEGKILASTQQSLTMQPDLSSHPLVSRVMRDYVPSGGLWSTSDTLYQASVIPLVRGPSLIGYLVTALQFSNALAQEIAQVSGTEVAILARAGADTRIVASTLPESGSDRLIEIINQSEDVNRTVFDQASVVSRFEADIDGERMAVRIAPLERQEGATVGAIVTLASPDRQLSAFREILTMLALAGLVAILLALLASYALSKTVLRPVERLSKVAEAAASGDLHHQFEIHGSDEFGRLGRAFNRLLDEVRQEHELERYMGELDQQQGESNGYDSDRRMATTQRDASEADDQGCVVLALWVKHIDGQAPGEWVRTALKDEGAAFTRVFGLWAFGWFPAPHAASTAIAAALRLGKELSRQGTEIRAALINSDVRAADLTPREAATQIFSGNACERLLGLLPMLTRDGLFIGGGVSRDVAGDCRSLLQDLDAYNPGEDTVVSLSDSIKAYATRPKTEVSKRGQHRAIVPGTVLGNRYAVQALLGRGGMGVVYRAHDNVLDEVVALKMLRPDVVEDQARIERLKSEIRLARRISHPNVVRTFDFGEIDGVPFISMEHVRGISLREALDRTGRVQIDAGLRIAKQLCEGLGAAHNVGVIHRDIKPENILLTHAGVAKLMDFGIAQPITGGLMKREKGANFEGTPHYLSPEQINGQPVDERSDIYAMGVVLMQMFTGDLPHKGENTLDICMSHLEKLPPPPSTLLREMPRWLELLILRCLEKQPGRRYASTTALRQGLNG